VAFSRAATASAWTASAAKVPRNSGFLFSQTSLTAIHDSIGVYNDDEEPMINRGIDWFMMWKWYHFKFFWIMLALGVLFRVVVLRHYELVAWNKTRLFSITASAVSAICATWLPILPVLMFIPLIIAIGDLRASSLFVATPLIAVSATVQAALIDRALLRFWLKTSPKTSFAVLFVANLLVVSIALSLVLGWAFYHPIEVIA
jgi:hypothetical protein